MSGKWVQDIDANWQVPYVGGWCLVYVTDAYVYNGAVLTEFYGSASDAWDGASYKHFEYPPMGMTVPIYFHLGNEPAGHVAIRLDDGMVASSSLAGEHNQGFIYPNIDAMIADYAVYNGGCTYMGWTEDVVGARVVHYQEDQVVPPVIPPVAPPEPPVIVPKPPVIIEPPIEPPVVAEPPVVEEPIVVEDTTVEQPIKPNWRQILYTIFKNLINWLKEKKWNK